MEGRGTHSIGCIRAGLSNVSRRITEADLGILLVCVIMCGAALLQGIYVAFHIEPSIRRVQATYRGWVWAYGVAFAIAWVLLHKFMSIMGWHAKTKSIHEGSHLKHRRFGLKGQFSPDSGVFQFANSEFYSVLITILTVKMDSAPSKIPGAPIILELDNYNLDFEKIWPDFFKIVPKKFVHSGPNH